MTLSPESSFEKVLKTFSCDKSKRKDVTLHWQCNICSGVEDIGRMGYSKVVARYQEVSVDLLQCTIGYERVLGKKSAKSVKS